MNESILKTFARRGVELLYQDDSVLYELLEREYHRQANTLALVASSSIVDPSVLACEGMVPVNVTAEGYPGNRFHAGCSLIDEIERLAIERAKQAFKAQYANVQPHCASSANEIVMLSLLKPGDTILGMQLQSGGHLTHGAKASISGQYFKAVGYGIGDDGLIDYDQVAELAKQCKPRLIVCGATAYPRAINFVRFREIADEVGAFLLADITHIAALVIAGLHPSPIDVAHFTTTCTHKQLYGPRGGLILMGQDHLGPAPDGKRGLSEMIQSAVFPLLQGAPVPNVIAAKARALARATTPDFKILADAIVANARALAGYFVEKGYDLISGGTDNHIILINLIDRSLTGVVAEKALEESHIIVNKNKIPGDKRSSLVTSGIRLGTNSVAVRGMGPGQMKRCAALIDRVLTSIDVLGERDYRLDGRVRDEVRAEVTHLCQEFPIPRYPTVGQ
ncbi:MAG TPA: serine hydroxymethyltransferase [Pyrinomonadaceae bacterium]|jgi:glycine hydroxymethyltransferase